MARSNISTWRENRRRLRDYATKLSEGIGGPPEESGWRHTGPASFSFRQVFDRADNECHKKKLHSGERLFDRTLRAMRLDDQELQNLQWVAYALKSEDGWEAHVPMPTTLRGKQKGFGGRQITAVWLNEANTIDEAMVRKLAR